MDVVVDFSGGIFNGGTALPATFNSSTVTSSRIANVFKYAFSGCSSLLVDRRTSSSITNCVSCSSGSYAMICFTLPFVISLTSEVMVAPYFVAICDKRLISLIPIPSEIDVSK